MAYHAGKVVGWCNANDRRSYDMVLRRDQGWKPSSSSGCFYYTAKHLSQEDMAFLESMPEGIQVAIEGVSGTLNCFPFRAIQILSLEILLRAGWTRCV